RGRCSPQVLNLLATDTPNSLGLTGNYAALPSEFCTVIKRVRLWLDKCLEDHTRYCPKTDSALPTRVLDLETGDHNSIRLYESQHEKAKYMCLSYRWGDAEVIRTTRENLE